MKKGLAAIGKGIMDGSEAGILKEIQSCDLNSIHNGKFISL
jgi:hypothetical protein